MALAVRDEFASGRSYFGVADLVTFHAETHKFESHYDDYLVGPWPEAMRPLPRTIARHACRLDLGPAAAACKGSTTRSFRLRSRRSSSRR